MATLEQQSDGLALFSLQDVGMCLQEPEVSGVAVSLADREIHMVGALHLIAQISKLRGFMTASEGSYSAETIIDRYGSDFSDIVARVGQRTDLLRREATFQLKMGSGFMALAAAGTFPAEDVHAAWEVYRSDFVGQFEGSQGSDARSVLKRTVMQAAKNSRNQ